MSVEPREREGRLCECAWHCHAKDPCPNLRDERSNCCIECVRINLYACTAYEKGKCEGAGAPVAALGAPRRFEVRTDEVWSKHAVEAALALRYADGWRLVTSVRFWDDGNEGSILVFEREAAS